MARVIFMVVRLARKLKDVGKYSMEKRSAGNPEAAKVLIKLLGVGRIS